MSLVDFKTSLYYWNVCSGTFVTYSCNSVVTASIWKNLDSFPTKGITPCCFMNLAKMPDDSSYRFLWTSSLHSASLCNTNVSPTYRGISVYLQIKIHDSTHRIPETHQGAISKTPGPKRIPTGTSSPCQREGKLGQDLVKISVLTTYFYVSLCANDLFLPFMFHFEPLPPFPTPPPSMLSPYKGPQCPGAPEDSSNILRHFFMYPNYPTVPYSCRFCSNSSLESPRPTCREILQRVLSFNSGNVLTSTNDWLTHVRWSLPPLKLLWFSDSNHFQHFSVSCGSFLLEFCNFRFQLSLILQLGLLSLLVFTSLYDMFVEIWLQLDASGLRCRISGS